MAVPHFCYESDQQRKSLPGAGTVRIMLRFSRQQRGSLSEITSESAMALAAQRRSLIHEATADMMRRDTCKEKCTLRGKK